MIEKELVLSTKKSIHPPIKVTVDKVVYLNNPLSRALFDELKEHEKAALGGDIQALYAQVRAIFDIPLETLNKLDMRDIKTLLEYTMTKVFGSTGKETKDEQKEKKE